MAEIAKINIVPLFLTAKSKEELLEKMIKNNMINGKAYNYMPPSKEGSEYVVWYYGDPFNDKNIEGVAFDIKTEESK